MLCKELLVAVLVGATASGAYAACAGNCNGHGWCRYHDRCDCYADWTGTDCSLRACPMGVAFADGSASGHSYSECSGRGTCDHDTGLCSCVEGYSGHDCGRTTCPNDCSGHGTCESVDTLSSAYAGWDHSKSRACRCDGGYGGADCSKRLCPVGDDPLTTEIECSGSSKGAQQEEVQVVTLSGDRNIAGEVTLAYTDAYGQTWTTTPINIAGDNEFDVEVPSTASACTFSYAFATSASAAGSAGPSNPCYSSTVAQMDSAVSSSLGLKNVRVAKSSDVTSTGKFAVTVDEFPQQYTDGGHVGKISSAGAVSTVTAKSADNANNIKRALEALPFNVIPSVTVKRHSTTIRGEDVTASNTAGNQYKQIYNVTFSDAANTGDQVMLGCDATGCDSDGCAPRFSGLMHNKHISTKKSTHTAVPQTTSQTTIHAVDQGSFRIRSWQADQTAAAVAFTSGKATLYWPLGSGRTDSASWQYNDNAATIQTALRTIEGWEGVTVSCSGSEGTASHDCLVTYAAGYDDGAKIPYMTYTNYLTSGTAQTVNSLSGSAAAKTVTVTAASAVTGLAVDDIRGWVYIEGCDPELGGTGYYEVTATAGATVTVYAPDADFTATGCAAGTKQVWPATPPMPMWTEYSNSVSMSSTSLEVHVSTGSASTGLMRVVKGATANAGGQTIDVTGTAAAAEDSINTLLYAAVDGNTVGEACTVSKTSLTANAVDELKFVITCPGWAADNLAFNPGTVTGTVTARHRRRADPRKLNHMVAVGDTITVSASQTQTGTLASTYADPNANKKFKVRSFEWSSNTDALVYAKVWPSPSDDFDITDMVAGGTNSTRFSRAVTDLTSNNAERVKFIIENGAGTPACSSNAGTYTFSYDGETTSVIQAQAVAADIQEALASLSNLHHVPDVTVSCLNTAFQTIMVDFQGQEGDAHKLTMDSSAVSTVANRFRVSSNEGSVFVDGVTTVDEVALDMAPGGMINITSRETITAYGVQLDNVAAAAPVTCTAPACTGLVFEYNGAYTDVVDLYGTTTYTAAAIYQAQIATLPGLETVVTGDITVASATSGTTAPPGYSGVTNLWSVAVKLPEGADGSKFHVYQHHISGTTVALHASGNTGLYVTRTRNNNGRSFKLNKVYENHASSVSKLVVLAAGDGTYTIGTTGAARFSQVVDATNGNDLDVDIHTAWVYGMDDATANGVKGNANQFTGAPTATTLTVDKADAGSNDAVFFSNPYAYLGRGPDKLFVDPQPDSMTNEAVTLYYSGPAGSCVVSEAVRGSTEAKECSGRGNCDYETGTCACDSGFTLEACSVQTVLV